MRFTFFTALAGLYLASSVQANPVPIDNIAIAELEARQQSCNADNCLRALRGKPAYYPSYCSSYIQATTTSTAHATTTSTSTLYVVHRGPIGSYERLTLRTQDYHAQRNTREIHHNGVSQISLLAVNNYPYHAYKRHPKSSTITITATIVPAQPLPTTPPTLPLTSIVPLPTTDIPWAKEKRNGPTTSSVPSDIATCGPSRISSACSCLVTPTTTTITTTSTSTAHTTKSLTLLAGTSTSTTTITSTVTISPTTIAPIPTPDW
ncbi:MAG: hypothetical protein M1827_006912 [Pycnora praestabilis]|nr:MAG: hypothetical protein M1827_006912 [Pycnora praestabilis]